MSERYWPPHLPLLPLRDGYAYSTGNNVVRAQMEYGPAKVRRRASSAMSNISCTYLLKRHFQSESGDMHDQYAIFLAFMEETEGMSFWLPDPLDVTQEIKVRIKAASEDRGVTLTPDNSSKQWKVTLDMEVWPLARRPRA